MIKTIELMKHSLRRIPMVGQLALGVQGMWMRRTFADSSTYWQARYGRGGNSGDGSFGRLAQFKAEVVNTFVRDNSIQSVLELGCGDGNQLLLAEYPRYMGLDIAPCAIEKCQETFAEVESKQFLLYDPSTFDEVVESLRCDLSLSMDVIYHLVEEEVFETYMGHLFAAASRFVIVYASNFEHRDALPHVRHRCFTDWVEVNLPRWQLIQHIPNRYPHVVGKESVTSSASFYIFGRTTT